MAAMQVRRAIHADDPTPTGEGFDLSGSRASASWPGRCRSSPPSSRAAFGALIGSLMLAIGLAGCGGGEGESTEAVVSQGNAAQIRAEYAQVDPVRAAAFDAWSGRSAASAGAQSPAGSTTPSPALVSAASYPGTTPADASNTGTATTSGADPAGGQSPGDDGNGGSGGNGVTSASDTATDPNLTSTQFALEALAAINAARAQSRICGDVSYPPVPPLKWNARAAFAALLEVEWMQRDNAFGHEWPTGEHVWHRLAMAGYDWNRADENIAAGFRTLDTAMKAWIDSPSHCKALMRADVVDVGVAVIPGEASNTYLSYWAMVLAAPR